MATQGKNRDYIDKDTLRKYLQGELPPKEAHRIEKLILNNPFYQEALDGLETLDEEENQQDLTDLSNQIQKRTQSSKGDTSFKFYRIAAAILLLAVFSYVIVYTTSRMGEVSKNETLSQKQDAVEEGKQVPAVSPEIIEDTLVESSETGDHEARQSEIEMAARENEGTEQKIDETDSKLQPEPEESLAESLDISAPQEAQEKQALVISEELHDELTLTASDDPYDLEGETELDPDTPEDRSEIAFVDEEDPVNRQNNRSGEIAIEQENKSGKSGTETEPVLSEYNQATAPDSDIEEEEFLKPVPVNGYKGLDEYIKDNINYPARERTEGIEGIVKLSFIINKDSIPEKIQVIQSLSPDCDKEAKRLLKEGPKWIPVYLNEELYDADQEYSIYFQINE